MPPLPLFFYLLLMAVATYFLLNGWLWGAGYEPTKKSVRQKIIGLLEERLSADRFVLYDLGSGCGGVLIDVAERFPNALCTGIEADPLKCAIARWRVRKLGLQHHLMITRGNLLKTDLSDADIVYMFLSPLILTKQEFRDKIKKLKPECLIVSYCHRILGVEPAAVIGKDLFVYLRSLF